MQIKRGIGPKAMTLQGGAEPVSAGKEKLVISGRWPASAVLGRSTTVKMAAVAFSARAVLLGPSALYVP
jgi:hypothetical protein